MLLSNSRPTKDSCFQKRYMRVLIKSLQEYPQIIIIMTVFQPHRSNNFSRSVNTANAFLSFSSTFPAQFLAVLLRLLCPFSPEPTLFHIIFFTRTYFKICLDIFIVFEYSLIVGYMNNSRQWLPSFLQDFKNRFWIYLAVTLVESCLFLIFNNNFNSIICKLFNKFNINSSVFLSSDVCWPTLG